MKYIVALLLTAITSIAHAEVFATSKNEQGGELILMTNKGSCGKGERTIIARGSDGRTTIGCWFYTEPYIFATYDNGQQRMYDDKGWTLAPKVRDQVKPKYEY